MSFFIVVQLVLITALATIVATSWSSSTSSSYRAASVMHFPYNMSANWTVAAITARNLEAYTSYTSEASTQGAQIIVFPEGGTGYLLAGDPQIRQWCETMPSPGWRATNCSTYTVTDYIDSGMQHAYWASCAAQLYHMDIVINFGYHDLAKEAYYNSDAAFNQDGYLLAIYRKSHINAAPYLKQPAVPDPVTFVSSFGVTFGMFTCFDMWFNNPVAMDIDLLYVTDFAYPNGMGSLAPLMTIDAIHAGWSYHHRVNLISATLFPTGGAGAFHKGVVLGVNAYQPYVETWHSVAVHDVPIINRTPSLSAETDHHTVPPRTVQEPPMTMIQEASTFDLKCFDEMATCHEFTPSPNTTIYTNVAYNGSFASVSCGFTVTTMSTSNHRWFFAAGQVDMVPQSNGTANANQVAFCIVLHCDDENVNCNLGGSDPGYWTSDLIVGDVTVVTTVSGGMNGSVPLGFFPLYEYVNTTAVSASNPFPQAWPTTESVAAFVNARTTTTQTFVTIVSPNDAVAQTLPMYTIGSYITAKGS